MSVKLVWCLLLSFVTFFSVANSSFIFPKFFRAWWIEFIYDDFFPFNFSGHYQINHFTWVFFEFVRGIFALGTCKNRKNWKIAFRYSRTSSRIHGNGGFISTTNTGSFIFTFNGLRMNIYIVMFISWIVLKTARELARGTDYHCPVSFKIIVRYPLRMQLCLRTKKNQFFLTLWRTLNTNFLVSTILQVLRI